MLGLNRQGKLHNLNTVDKKAQRDLKLSSAQPMH